MKLLGPRDNADPFPTALPVDLVVVGRFNAIGQGKDEKCELQIEKTIYGSAPKNPLPMESGCGDRKRYVVRLAPEAYHDIYGIEWLYEDLSQVPAEEAYWAAVMDCEVLSSPHIFVGEEVSADGYHSHTVKVVKTLYGFPLQPGQRVDAYMSSDRYSLAFEMRPVVRKGNTIYLATEVDHEKKGGLTFVVQRRLPGALESAVLAALGRREIYPLVAKSRRSSEKLADIIFRGSIRESIALLGSSLPETVALAASTLIHHKDAAQSEVIVAIEQDLFRVKEEGSKSFERLRNLIKLLRYFGEGSPTGEAGRLLDKLMREIPAQPQSPPSRLFGINGKHRGELGDANHALTWLLFTMKEADWDPYLPKLLQLRATTKGHWQSEVQMALDATQIENKADLARAQDGKKATTLKRIPPAKPCGPGAHTIAFAGAGKQILTVGTNNEACLWNLAAMKLDRHFPLPIHCKVVSVRDDGRYLTCYDETVMKAMRNTKYGAKEQMNSATIVDVESGKVVTTATLPTGWRTNGFRFIDDHRAIVATEQHATVFDYFTGQVESDVRPEKEGVPSEDGKELYDIYCVGKAPCALEVYAVNTRTGHARQVGEGSMNASTQGLAGLVPGGRYLYMTFPVVGIYDRNSLEPVASKDVAQEVKSIVFSSDGSVYALTTGDCRRRTDFGFVTGPSCPRTPMSLLRVYDTLKSEMRAALQVPEDWAKNLVFSPDGKQLALLAGDGTVRLWRMDPLP